MPRVVIEIEDIFGTEKYRIKCTPGVAEILSKSRSGNELTNAESAAIRFVKTALEESDKQDPTRSRLWLPKADRRIE